MTRVLKKIAAITFAVVTICVVAVGGWFAAYNYRTTSSGNIDGEQPNEGVTFGITKISSADYAAYGVSPLAESACSITATVKDESGDAPEELQGVTFSVGWKSTSSSEISDFVDLSADGNVATLSFLKPFTIQIVLTATSVLDPSKKGTTTFDYAKRVEGVMVSLGGSESEISGGEVKTLSLPDYSVGGSSSEWSATMNPCSSAIFGDGTVQGNITSLRYSISPTTELVDKIKSLNSSLSSITGKTKTTPGSMAAAFAIRDLIEDTLDDSILMVSGYRSTLYNALAAVENHFNVTITCQVSNLSGQTFSFNYTLNLTNTALHIASVSMDKVNVVI